MSTSVEVNANPYIYMLYYCNQNNSTAVYQIDLSDVCTMYYDGNGDIQISTWLVSAYSQPSPMTVLQSYTLANVQLFYNDFYTIPSIISVNQYYQISTTNLASIRADSSMLGYRIFDTTARTVKAWNGLTWA